MSNSWRLVRPFPRYGRFSIFRDGDRPPAWICCAPTLNYPRMAVEVFIVWYNLVGINRVVVKILEVQCYRGLFWKSYLGQCSWLLNARINVLWIKQHQNRFYALSPVHTTRVYGRECGSFDTWFSKRCPRLRAMWPDHLWTLLLLTVNNRTNQINSYICCVLGLLFC